MKTSEVVALALSALACLLALVALLRPAPVVLEPLPSAEELRYLRWERDIMEIELRDHHQRGGKLILPSPGESKLSLTLARALAENARRRAGQP